MEIATPARPLAPLVRSDLRSQFLLGLNLIDGVTDGRVEDDMLRPLLS